jgi:hypothetical protein
VAFEQVFFRFPRLYCINIILPVLHSHHHPHAAFAEGKTGKDLEPSENNVLSETREYFLEKYLYTEWDLWCTK